MSFNSWEDDRPLQNLALAQNNGTKVRGFAEFIDPRPKGRGNMSIKRLHIATSFNSWEDDQPHPNGL